VEFATASVKGRTMMKTIKLALVTMAIATPGAAFAGYANNYNCPGDSGDAYMELVDSAGNTIELCQPTYLTPQSYDLESISFITGYSGGVPIYEEAFAHVSSFTLYAGDGLIIEAENPGHLRGCEWSVSEGTYSGSPSYCFDLTLDHYISVSVSPIIP